MGQNLKKIVIGALVVVIAIVGIGWYVHRDKSSDPKYRTDVVKRGDLTATISATGTVEPEEVVDVGAQVAGEILEFGKDDGGKMIDYGSAVQAGTILAKIDDSTYLADVDTAKASLGQAQSGQLRAEADLGQMKAKLNQAERDWERAQKLGPSEALAPTQYDAYKANYETAKANVGVDEAAIAQAKAGVMQAQATLEKAQRNLSYCTIKSPVNGVVIDRRVNIGQTVVSSLNAPSLFLIAKDLTRIQVWVAVNEADVGSIAAGMPVTFSVDAIPGRKFKGVVGKTRLNATMTQNVVTYTVEVNTDNSDGKLLPYLTANVQFQVGAAKDVLMVPNSALRYQPQASLVAPQFRDSLAKGGRGRSGDKSAGASNPGKVWVVDGQYLKPISVTTGLTDGASTEVRGEGLSEDMDVVLGEQVAQASGGPGGNVNPFTPQLGRARQPANAPAGQGGQGGGPGGAGGGQGGGGGGAGGGHGSSR